MTTKEQIIEAAKAAIKDSRNTPPENQAQYVALELLKAIQEPSAQMVDDGEASPVRDARNIPVSIKCWQAMLSALTKQLTDEGK